MSHRHRVRNVPGLQRTLATVLFTDIVGSTARAAELGDRRWRELLSRHDEVVRRLLRRWAGVEINTAGDGFVARFADPALGRDAENLRYAQWTARHTPCRSSSRARRSRLCASQ